MTHPDARTDSYDPRSCAALIHGLSRRTFIWRDDGSVKLQMYSQNGQLMYAQHQTATGTLDDAYVYLDGKLITQADIGVQNLFQHVDALGSPIATTNGHGALVSRTRYEPHGNTAAGTNPDGPGFTGHVNDPGTGLVYMQQRYYDPIAGRFLSVDPVSTDMKTAGAFNRYGYAHNSPYRYTDPTGESPFGYLLKLLDNGGRKVIGKLSDKADAVAARQRGENVLVGTKQRAKQVEIAKSGGDGSGLMEHGGHELNDGSVGDPHFQTQGSPGHTFWGDQAGVASLDELLEAILIPIWAAPTTLAPGTLYGPGTPYLTQQAYDSALRPNSGVARGADHVDMTAMRGLAEAFSKGDFVKRPE